MNNKGLSLIIAVFGVMLLGVLGWSLAMMLGGNFDAGLRALRSEQALYCAEAGMHWARLQLANDSSWRTSSDEDCADAGDWLVHSFGPGQYAVCSRNATLAESVDGSLVAEVRAFVPSQNSYQARREVKLIATLGGFDQVVQTNGGVFNWTGMTTDSEVMDDLELAFYNGDGDGILNEAGIDYRSSTPVRPPAGNRVYQRSVKEKSFPVLDMQMLENTARSMDHVWEPPMSAKIRSVIPYGTANEFTIDLDRAVFNDTPRTVYSDSGSLIRNISRGSWDVFGAAALITSVIDADTVRVQLVGLSWLPGERIIVVPVLMVNPGFNLNQRTYTVTLPFNYFRGFTSGQMVGNALRNLSSSRGLWNYTGWGTITAIRTSPPFTVTVELDSSVTTAQMNDTLWRIGDPVCVSKRYTEDDCGGQGDLRRRQLWFLGSDLVLDTNPGDIDARRTGIVAEGDIVIRGSNGIFCSERPMAYPNLGTKNGAIWSPDLPRGKWRETRLNNRLFEDIVFSENGDVFFNCIDASAVFGRNVILTGDVRLRPNENLSQLQGYGWGFSQSTWNEQ